MGLGRLILGLRSVNRELAVLTERLPEDAAQLPGGDSGVESREDFLARASEGGGPRTFKMGLRSVGAVKKEAEAASKSVKQLAADTKAATKEAEDLMAQFRTFQGMYSQANFLPGLGSSNLIQSQTREALLMLYALSFRVPGMEKFRKMIRTGGFGINASEFNEIDQDITGMTKRGGM